MTIITEKNKSGDSSLHDWFNKSKSSDGKKGWVQLGGKYAGKPCAKQPGQKTKPKCGSSKMKRNLNKDEEAAAFRRKNKKDPNPNRKGKAINVSTEETIDQLFRKTLEEKKAQKCWPGYEKKGTKKMFGKTYNNCVKKEETEVKESHKNPESVKGIAKELDKAVEMHKSQAKRLRKAGVSEGKSDGDPCWDTHKQVGMKKKNGRMVPNCVPKEEFSDWRSEIKEGAAWTKKSGKNASGGLNEKGRKSYERENPGSDLKAPSKKVGNKRRASFCARMKGMKKKLTSAKTANDPDSRINKSLRAWNC